MTRRGGRKRVAAGRPRLDAGQAVTSLRRAAADPERVRVSVEGEAVGYAPAAVVAELGLVRGAILDTEAADRLADAIDELGAVRVALRTLRRATRSREEVRRRLARAGHGERAVRSALDAAAEAGLIDDERLARNAARRFVDDAKGGARLLEAKLATRGIARSITSEAAAEVAPDLDEAAIARRLAESRIARARADEPEERVVRRTLAFLARRGFGADVCRDAVRAAVAGRGSVR